jgi:NADH dehydrogenase FAD-containing subunit
MNYLKDADFGTTGHFELAGVYHSNRPFDATLATTVSMERIKSLLLLGAGGSHLQVLMQLARHRRTDLDVTLVTPWSYKTRSAMTADCVGGDIPLADCQIDLEPLVKQAGVRWISARCCGLDANTSSVTLDYGASGTTVTGQRTSAIVGRPSVLTCDYLSINIGTVMERSQLDVFLPGASEHALLYKPSEQFVNRWTQTVNQARSQPGQFLGVCVIGADTPGVELCFAIRNRLKNAGIPHQVHLLTNGQTLAGDQTASVRKRVVALLKTHGVAVVPQRCLRVQAHGVELDNGTTVTAHTVVMATAERPPGWLAHSGLAVDSAGRVKVNAHLQSTSHPRVFAAGGVAMRPGSTGGKSGINEQSAVAELAPNLLAAINDQSMTHYSPSVASVSFLSCGDRHAIASWGPLTAEGRWVWHLKHRRDHNAMAGLG